MTPLTQGTDFSGRGNSLLNFDIPQSSHSGRSYRLPTDLDHDSPFAKPLYTQEPLDEFNPLGEDMANMPGLDLNFDADGNLVDFGDLGLELPALPGIAAYQEQLQIQAVDAANLDTNKWQDAGDNVIIMGEDPLPDAEPFPRRSTAANLTEPTSESPEIVEAKAPLRRGKPRRKHQMIDGRDYVTAAEIRSWSANYLDNMKANLKSHRTTSTTQARHNAKAFLFDNGLAGVAKPPLGPAHPLAKMFSGMSLLAHLQGRDPEQESDFQPRGRRRTSAEAFPDAQVEDRNTRQKTGAQNDGDELGRGLNDDIGAIMFGEDIAPEMGLNAAGGLEDRLSSRARKCAEETSCSESIAPPR